MQWGLADEKLKARFGDCERCTQKGIKPGIICLRTGGGVIKGGPLAGFPVRSTKEAWALVRYYMASTRSWTGGKVDEFKAFRSMGICPVGAVDSLAFDVFRGVMRAHDGMGGLAYYPGRFADSPLGEPLWYSQIVEAILVEKGRVQEAQREAKERGAKG